MVMEFQYALLARLQLRGGSGAFDELFKRRLQQSRRLVRLPSARSSRQPAQRCCATDSDESVIAELSERGNRQLVARVQFPTWRDRCRSSGNPRSHSTDAPPIAGTFSGSRDQGWTAVSDMAGQS
jgi:hypothetical protein